MGGSVDRAVVGMRRVGLGDRMGSWQATWAAEVQGRLGELPIGDHRVRGRQRSLGGAGRTTGLGRVAVKGRGVRRAPGMIVGTMRGRMVCLGRGHTMHGWDRVQGKSGGVRRMDSAGGGVGSAPVDSKCRFTPP